jgi:hypothetical protein
MEIGIMFKSLERSIIDEAPAGVSVVRDLPGGWLAIIAKHPNKVPLVDYTKHPSETLMAYKMAAAERWAA